MNTVSLRTCSAEIDECPVLFSPVVVDVAHATTLPSMRYFLVMLCLFGNVLVARTHHPAFVLPGAKVKVDDCVSVDQIYCLPLTCCEIVDQLLLSLIYIFRISCRWSSPPPIPLTFH